MFIKKIKRLLEYLTNRTLLKARLHKLPLAFVEDLIELKSLIPEVNNIFDVGANDGEFSLAANYLWPNSYLYLFEPLPDKVIKLNDLLKTRKIKGIVYPFALSSNEGSSIFFKYNYDRLSSFLKPDDKLREYYANQSNYSEIIVDQRKFDNLFNLSENSSNIVKIDTQGYELEVLIRLM